MKVLITGVNGFVGQRLALVLIAGGHEVYGLDVTASAVNGLRVFFQQDLAETFSVAEKFDAVFHLGAYNVTHVGERAAARYEQVNVRGTANLLRAVKSGRFVFLSTTKVYRQQGVALVETSPLGPQADYEQSKLAAEKLCQAQVAPEQLFIFRSVNISGPGQSVKAIVPVFFERAMAEAPLEITVAPDTVLQLVWVDDIVSLFLRVLETRTPGGIFNVASDETIRVDELAERIIRLCGSRSEKKFLASGRTVFSPVDFQKVRGALDWKPQVTISEMLKIYYEYRREKL